MTSRRGFLETSSALFGLVLAKLQTPQEAVVALRNADSLQHAAAPIDSSADGAVGIVNVEDYGAVGNGLQDDTSALQRAIDALPRGGGKVTFPAGNYLISGEISGRSNIELDFGSATIKATGRFRSFFYFASAANVVVRGGRFDLGKPLLPEYRSYPTIYNAAFYFDVGCSNIEVIDSRFSNLYTNSIWFYHVTGHIDVVRCHFSSPTQTQQTNLQHISFTTVSATVMIDDCDFDNAAPTTPACGVCQIFASGTTNQFTIRNCRSNYGGRDSTGHHQLAAFAFYMDSVNVLVENCRLASTMAQAIRFTNVRAGVIHGCYVDSATHAQRSNQLISVESEYSAGVLQQGCQDIRIHNNTFLESADTTRVAIAISSYDYSTPATNVDVHDNRFLNMQTAVAIGGPHSGIHVYDNSVSGANGGAISLRIAPGGIAVGSLNGVTEKEGAFDDLSIRRNSFNVDVSGAQAISLSYVKTPAFTGAIGAIDVSHNTVAPAGTVATQAVALRGVSGSRGGRVTIQMNDVFDYVVGIDVANFPDVRIEGNNIRRCRIPVLNSGGIASLSTRMNKFGVGAISGVAQLVNGTVTVMTDEIRRSAGDSEYHVTLTRLRAAGSLGTLTLGAVVDGESFVVNSLKNDRRTEDADTSSLHWEIEH